MVTNEPLNLSNPNLRTLSLLEHIEDDPDITQATLADQLGVAVGTVNWHLKRLVDKGYVKVKRAQRRKLRYIITPQGIALRARLTVEYIERNMSLYRHTRKRVSDLVARVRSAGFQQLHVDGEQQGPEDILDICQLTCIEQGIEIVDDESGVPVLRIRGAKVNLELPEE